MATQPGQSPPKLPTMPTSAVVSRAVAKPLTPRSASKSQPTTPGRGNREGANRAPSTQKNKVVSESPKVTPRALGRALGLGTVEGETSSGKDEARPSSSKQGGARPSSRENDSRPSSRSGGDTTAVHMMAKYRKSSQENMVSPVIAAGPGVVGARSLKHHSSVVGITQTNANLLEISELPSSRSGSVDNIFTRQETLPILLRKESCDDMQIRFSSSVSDLRKELDEHHAARAMKLKAMPLGSAEVKMTNKAQKIKDYDAGTKWLNQYRLLETLGKGTFGKVKLAETDDGKKYAIKIVRRANMQKKRFGLGRANQNDQFEKLQREVAIMKKMEHPNIVKLYEVIDDESMDRIYIVMTYCAKGAVMDLEKDPKPIEENERWNIFRELTAAVAYLHSKGVLHRDIKPENMLLDSEGVLKLADFGVSAMFKTPDQQNDNMLSNYGTPTFSSPESIDMTASGVSGKMEDVWAMGITLYALTFGKLPYFSDNIMELHSMISKEPVPYPSEIDPSLKSLLNGLLEKDPKKRTTLVDVSKHEWITKGGKFPLVIDTDINLVQVSQQEISRSITTVDRFSMLIKVKTQMSRKAKEARRRLSRSARPSEEDGDSMLMSMASCMTPDTGLNSSRSADPIMDARRASELHDQLMDIKPRTVVHKEESDEESVCEFSTGSAVDGDSLDRVGEVSVPQMLRGQSERTMSVLVVSKSDLRNKIGGPPSPERTMTQGAPSSSKGDPSDDTSSKGGPSGVTSKGDPLEATSAGVPESSGSKPPVPADMPPAPAKTAALSTSSPVHAKTPANTGSKVARSKTPADEKSLKPSPPANAKT